MILLSSAVLRKAMFATSVSASEPEDEAMEIERVDVATSEVSHYTVQADENTLTVLPGFMGTAPIKPDAGIEP